MAERKIIDYKLELQAGKGFFALQLSNPAGWTKWTSVSPAELAAIAGMLGTSECYYDDKNGVIIKPANGTASALKKGSKELSSPPPLDVEAFSFPKKSTK